MRCGKEEFSEGATFHVFNRSIAERNLFRETEDYSFFLEKFTKKLDENPNEIFAYCLLPNHFHFCLRQNTDYEIYRIFNSVCTSYAMYYNRKYKRKGKLSAGKLQHKRVLFDDYLISLCKYIHYNPVKANIVEEVSEWPYSNYLEYARLRFNSIYSEELTIKYPEIFENYNQAIMDYEHYLE